MEQGDIEDFDGREKIVCPWHSYDFDLETGDSSYGLKVSQKEKRSINKTKDNWCLFNQIDAFLTMQIMSEDINDKKFILNDRKAKGAPIGQ